MRSSILAFVGFSCLIASFSLTSFAQQTKPADTQKPAEAHKTFKEVKFKLEWITSAKSTQATTPTVETVTLSAVDGETSMTTNPITSSDLYRRVTIRPEFQTDGSYLVALSVSEFTKDQERDIPRIETMVKVRTGDTKVVQSRLAKGTNYEFEYLFSITPVIE